MNITTTFYVVTEKDREIKAVRPTGKKQKLTHQVREIESGALYYINVNRLFETRVRAQSAIDDHRL